VHHAPRTMTRETEGEALKLRTADAIAVAGVEGWRVQATAFLVDWRVEEGAESARSGTLKIATSVTRSGEGEDTGAGHWRGQESGADEGWQRGGR
jgi:hypothetical protein